MLIVTYCLPGAFAKAVICTTEAVGTRPTIANKGASNQLDCCSAPGALAKAVIFTTEPVGTRATDANKPAGAPRRDQVRGDTPP